jgi:8-oxo-dGTP pyrophosphatase MutT (NUDIX family)
MPISGYLHHLRAKIGHDLVMAPAAAAIIFDDRGRVLLVKHTEGGWGVVGGAVEPDEHPADAVVREAWEETGLLVEPLRVFGVYGGPEFHVTYPNGDELSCQGTAFECRVVGGSLRPDLDEVSELAYFSQTEAAGLGMSPLQCVILADAFSGQSGEEARFKAPTWQPPADGVRAGGVSDYLRGLREQVGHDLLFIPAVGAIVCDEEGRVLLQQRADNGQWHPPAGAIEPHEHPADAVVREMWEETGLLVEPLRVTGVYGGSDFRGTSPNGDQIAVYSVIFECRVVGGEASPDGIEVAALGYFAPEELTEDFLLKRWQRRVFDALDRQGPAYFEPPTWQPPV